MWRLCWKMNDLISQCDSAKWDGRNISTATKDLFGVLHATWSHKKLSCLMFIVKSYCPIPHGEDSKKEHNEISIMWMLVSLSFDIQSSSWKLLSHFRHPSCMFVLLPFVRIQGGRCRVCRKLCFYFMDSSMPTVFSLILKYECVAVTWFKRKILRWKYWNQTHWELKVLSVHHH